MGFELTGIFFDVIYINANLLEYFEALKISSLTYKSKQHSPQYHPYKYLILWYLPIIRHFVFKMRYSFNREIQNVHYNTPHYFEWGRFPIFEIPVKCTQIQISECAFFPWQTVLLSAIELPMLCRRIFIVITFCGNVMSYGVPKLGQNLPR